MKRIVKSFAIAAVSALAFISCSQEQNPVSQENGIHFTIRTSENPQVKSFIESNLDGTYTPKWSKGDELAMFVGTINDKSKPTATLTNSNEKGLTAKFDGQVAGIEGNGTFKSFAPARAFATGYSNGNVGITLAETQKPSSLTIDEACDILVGKETTYLADAAGEVAIDDLFFKRMFSVVKVALKGPASLNGEKVSKFSLTAPEGTVLTGRAAIDLTTATIDKWNIDNNSVTATYEADAPVFGGASGLENAVWLVVNPVTIASGAKVVFAGETADYTFSKEVTLSKALTFPESQLAVINLTLTEENCTKKAAGNAYVLHEDELIEGDYLVVYEGKAMKAAVKKDRLDYADVIVKDKRIESSDESIIWHIAPSAEYWTIFSDNTKSFAAGTGVKNKAQLLEDGTDDMSMWTISKSKSASTFEFINKKNKAANVNYTLRNNGTNGFACYATATGGPLSLYRLSGPIDNTLPTLSVDQTSKVWAADATDAFVVKVTVNSEGGDWNVTPTVLDWASITVDKTAGTITVTPNGANTTKTANEATLIVSHASDASLTKEISLKQNGVGDAALTEKTATIQFGTDNVKIDQASVTANDNQKNSWTITTVGTTSFNPYPLYYQVGSKNSAAKSITFTTTLPEDAEVTSISAKFGGNTSTAGTITLKVGETIVGTGTLNGKNDVTVTSTSTAAGNKVTITVTNIAKGVKCYNIQVKYKTAN